MRPVDRPFYVIVLYGVVMNVLDMVLQIGLVANLVFPEPTLPEPRFVTRTQRISQWCSDKPARLLADRALDQRPSTRVVGIIRRQCPDRVHMIWQNHPCHDLERVCRAHRPHSSTQRVNGNVLSENSLPTVRRKREEIGGPGRLCTSKSRHALNIARSCAKRTLRDCVGPVACATRTILNLMYTTARAARKAHATRLRRTGSVRYAHDLEPSVHHRTSRAQSARYETQTPRQMGAFEKQHGVSVTGPA